MSLQMKSSVGTRLRRAPALFTDVCQDLACGHRRVPALVADVRQLLFFRGWRAIVSRAGYSSRL